MTFLKQFNFSLVMIPPFEMLQTKLERDPTGGCQGGVGFGRQECMRSNGKPCSLNAPANCEGVFGTGCKGRKLLAWTSSQALLNLSFFILYCERKKNVTFFHLLNCFGPLDFIWRVRTCTQLIIVSFHVYLSLSFFNS